MKDLLKKLVETASPTGMEGAVRDVVKELVAPYADEMFVDVMGNLIVRKGQKTEDGLKVMLSAHIDEIGVVVTHIDDNGFVRFTNVGGVYPITCYSGRVQFTNGTMGVISMEKIEKRTEVQSLEQMYIDVGATSKENCPLQVGDFGVFDRPFLDLGKRVAAKAMDDRAGAAVLVELLKRLGDTPHELYFVFSTQEEVGLRGAKTAAYRIHPELGIALDVTLTGDTPNSRTMAVALGNGPAIKVKDSGMISSPMLVKYFAEMAEEIGIPYQFEVLTGGTTDAAVIQLTHEGVVSGCISIPCRYVHSPSEMIDMDDLENSVRLLVRTLSKPIHLID